ncbi:MAG TPA: riboflavin synthase [Gammaproteobacteria bacterium]|jgi:riboflavin synthase|nr:riboflavin synthase [Gammaproteobacteria bacterium]
MFTGIIQTVGKIEALTPQGGDLRLSIGTGELAMQDVKMGDSICVSGCCLTVIAKRAQAFDADASRETLSLTTLGDLKPGSLVNLEKALTLATPLGGHLVSGHVDGLGIVKSRREEARSVRFDIQVPQTLKHYIVHKGSVCVDGVSLTVNAIQDDTFDVNIIPHTMAHTIFGQYQPGSKVNLEVDVVARYVERLLAGRAP